MSQELSLTNSLTLKCHKKCRIDTNLIRRQLTMLEKSSSREKSKVYTEVLSKEKEQAILYQDRNPSVAKNINLAKHKIGFSNKSLLMKKGREFISIEWMTVLKIKGDSKSKYPLSKSRRVKHKLYSLKFNYFDNQDFLLNLKELLKKMNVIFLNQSLFQLITIQGVTRRLR